jgi:hypothetical protein
MLPALVLFAAVTASDASECAADRRRAAAIGSVTHPNAAEGEAETRAVEHWRRGRLSYAFVTEAAATGPVCAMQRITYDAPGFVFARTDDTSLRALTIALGPDAAADFRSARLVAATRDAAQTSEFRHLWYRGTRLGYTTATGSNALIAMRLDVFDAAVAQARRDSRSVR